MPQRQLPIEWGRKDRLPTGGEMQVAERVLI